MPSAPWTDAENDLTVAAYFAMLDEELAGVRYNKSEHRRALLPLLNNRPDKAIEFKHQNISAVLKGLGEVWIEGYKPAFNFQMSLVDAVQRWLDSNPLWLGRAAKRSSFTGLQDAAQKVAPFASTPFPDASMALKSAALKSVSNGAENQTSSMPVA